MLTLIELRVCALPALSSPVNVSADSAGTSLLRKYDGNWSPWHLCWARGGKVTQIPSAFQAMGGLPLRSHVVPYNISKRAITLSSIQA